MIQQGSKVEIIDPISKRKEIGLVREVTEDYFFEIVMDSGRTMVIERAEFSRFSVKQLSDEVITMAEFKEAEKLKEVSKRKTTNKNTWKEFESEVSAFFTTKRNALSGMWKGVSGSDTLHKKLYIECKYRDVLPYWAGFREQQELEKQSTGKIVVFSITDLTKYRGGDLWLVDKDDFKAALEYVSFVKSEGGKERYIVSSSKFSIIKHKKYKSLLSLFADTEKKAEIEGKIPVVAVTMKNRKGYLLGTNPKYFKDLNLIINKTNYNE